MATSITHWFGRSPRRVIESDVKEATAYKQCIQPFLITTRNPSFILRADGGKWPLIKEIFIADPKGGEVLDHLFLRFKDRRT